jgi:hypothetical protein
MLDMKHFIQLFGISSTSLKQFPEVDVPFTIKTPSKRSIGRVANWSLALFGAGAILLTNVEPISAQETQLIAKGCSNCERSVSPNSRVGESCPYCGAYWSDERTSYRDVTANTRTGPVAASAPLPSGFPVATRAVQPSFQQLMPDGPNTLTVVNRFSTWIGVGVVCGKVGQTYRFGIVRGVPAGGSITIRIPNGSFDVYWIRQDRPSSRFRNPNSFSVTGGNSRMQKILTVTIGSAGGETPVEETF